MTHLLWQYAYLQILDLLTTVAFLHNGVQEGNPFVRLALQLTGSALLGLLAVKAVGVGLGVLAYRTHRIQLLSRINVAFALLIVWNLVALILSPA